MNARPAPLAWFGALATLAALFVPVVLFAAPESYEPSPTVRLIDQAVSRGALTYSQGARQKLFYLFDRARLDPAYAVEGARPAKCGTAMLADLGNHLDELDAQTRALYQQMVIDGGPGHNEINTLFVYETTHFHIEYNDTGVNAVPLADVAPANGVPDFVEWTATACEFSWTTEVDNLGYLAPQLVGGPNNKYLITFQTQSSYGFTSVVSGQRTRITLHNNFLGFPPNDDPEGDQIGALRVTVAHEFKHAVQRMYTLWSEGGWVELDATWVEDIVYDNVNDYYNFISGGGSPFTNPELSLDNDGSTTTGSYEDCNWEHYQTEKLGNNHMLAFWQRRQLNPGEAVLTTYANNLIASGTNFTDSWGEYVAWNFACGQHGVAGYGYGEAPDYPTTPATSTHTTLPIATTGGTVNHLAANTRLIVNSGGVLSGQPEFTFTGAAAIPWRVTVVAKKLNGQIATVAMPLSGGAGVFQISDPQFDFGNVSWIALVIGNPATTGAASSYTFSVRAVAPIFINHFPAWNTTSTGQTAITATVTAGTTTPDAGSVQVSYRINGGAVTDLAMPATGNPNEYSILIPLSLGPPVDLLKVGDVVEYRISASSVAADHVSSPADPTAFHSYQVVTVFEPFEASTGWTAGAPGDAATTGIWERVAPVGTAAAPDADFTGPPGTFAFVTQNGVPGGAIGAADVDGGKTTLVSPVYDLATGGPYTSAIARYRRWYSNGLGAAVDDVWQVDVSNDGGTDWVNVETVPTGSESWVLVNADLMALLGTPDQVRFRFVANDGGAGSIIEAGVDDFEIVAIAQPTTATPLPGGLATLRLGPVAPNPTSRGMSAALSLPQAAEVHAVVRDLQGRTVRELSRGTLPAGNHVITWDGLVERGARAHAGVYFVTVSAGAQKLERKFVLLR